MRKGLIPVLSVLLLLGCTKPSPKPTGAAQKMTAQKKNTGSSPAVEPAPQAGSPELKPVVPAMTSPSGTVACVLRGLPWLSESGEGELSLVPGGKPFVRVTDVMAEIEIPVGDANAVFVRAQTAGWHIDGHHSAKDFSVRPLRVKVHDGFLVPSELSNLTLVRAQASKLWLTARPPVLVARAAPQTAQPYACDEVNIGPPPLLDAESYLPGDLETGRSMLLRPGEIPLSITPGQEPVAWLSGADPSTQVTELERRGELSLIAATNFTTLVFGWVAGEDLATPPPDEEGGVLMTSGLGGAMAEPGEPSSAYVCPHEVPVFVRLGGDLVQVGRIDAQTPLRGEATSKALKVQPPAGSQLIEGASFEIARNAVRDCKR